MTSESPPQSPPRPQPPPSRPGFDFVALAVATLAVLVYLGAELSLLSGRLGFPLDDSWIHLRFARQLAAGEGLSWNPGRLVAGSTAPLWTALLALGFAGPGAPLLWAKLLGALFFLVTVDATGRLATELGLGRGPARLAALLVASSHWLVWSALSGMEITLFLALSLWGMVLHLRERRSPEALPASLGVLGLACLARPEGFLLLGAALVDRAVAGRPPWRRLAWGLLAAVLAVAPILLFYRAIGDSFLPTTFSVKSDPGPRLLPSARYLRTVLDVLVRSQPVMLFFAGAGVLRLLERLGTRRDRGLLPAVWLVGLPVVAAVLGGDRGPVGNFGRYFFPLLPVVAVLGVLGWERAARWLGRRGGRRLPVALAALVLLPQALGLIVGPGRYAQTIANVEDSDVAAGRWLAPRLPEEAVLAMQDIGALGYHLSNLVIDLTGIVNPEILPVLRGRGPEDAASWQERLYGFLAERRPDYLVVFPRSYPDLVRQPGFRPVASFEVRANVTMAGDELVVFATPWTRHPLREGAGTP